MLRHALLTSLGSHLWRRSDPDYNQALVRLVIVAGGLWFAFSGIYATHAPSVAAIVFGRWLALATSAGAVVILVSILRWPGVSVTRRLLAITHDVCATSLAMYLGAQASAFFAVIYLIIILTSGVRFGAGYLGYAAVCSLAGFGLLYTFSPYWGSNLALSVNVVLVLTVVPAYMYPMIRGRQRVRAELEQRATHDSLTGLMNRAGFEQQLELLVTPGAPDQVLVYLDLDRFKAVNDAAGHAAGDQLLVGVARVLCDCVRSEDVCGRIGGDEFCVFLRHCPLSRGEQIATHIRERIHDYRMVWNGRQYTIGASIGVVSSRAVEDGPAFLRLADAACYAAKNSGRNTVHVLDTARMAVDTGEIRTLRPEE